MCAPRILSQWEGKGTLEKTGGSRYVGEWKAGLRHGSGTLWQRHADGSMRKIYAGQWDNDQQHGRGTLNYKNKDVYVGEWHRGVRAGVGICTYVARKPAPSQPFPATAGRLLACVAYLASLIATPHDARRYSDGGVYEGEWLNDKRHGFGTPPRHCPRLSARGRVPFLPTHYTVAPARRRPHP